MRSRFAKPYRVAVKGYPPTLCDRYGHGGILSTAWARRQPVGSATFPQLVCDLGSYLPSTPSRVMQHIMVAAKRPFRAPVRFQGQMHTAVNVPFAPALPMPSPVTAASRHR